MILFTTVRSGAPSNADVIGNVGFFLASCRLIIALLALNSFLLLIHGFQVSSQTVRIRSVASVFEEFDGPGGLFFVRRASLATWPTPLAHHEISSALTLVLPKTRVHERSILSAFLYVFPR